MRKFEELGGLAGGIAHDFNNALGVIIDWPRIGYEETVAGSASKDQFQKIYDVAHRCGVDVTTATPESAGLDSELSDGAAFIQKAYSPQSSASVVRSTLDQKVN